ncbi:MAG: hypothetical protein WA936_10440 [Erythrobacter sp.]
MKVIPVIGRYLFWFAFGVAIFAVGDFITGDESLRKHSLIIVLGITTGFAIGDFIRSRKSKSRNGFAR